MFVLAQVSLCGCLSLVDKDFHYCCVFGVRLQWSSYQENTELTHKIQELHALVCASCYAQYELLVLQNQFGPDSPHINYQQFKSPLQSLSEEELITGDQETFFCFRNCMIICSDFSFWVCCIIWVWIVGSPLWVFILMTYGNRHLSSWNRLGY